MLISELPRFSRMIFTFSKYGIGNRLEKNAELPEISQVRRAVSSLAGVFPYSHPKNVPNGAHTRSLPSKDILIKMSESTEAS